MARPSDRLGTFTHVSERRYVMELAGLGLTFDLGRVRREHQQLTGELVVKCTLAGARTVEGVLSAADFNCSSLQARVTRAKFLADRARTKPEDIDWVGLVEEFCQRVTVFDRQGQGAVTLADVPKRTEAAEFTVAGLPLFRRLPVIWFGDGGAAKSMLALYAAATIAATGEPVLYADWEFSEDEHRDRLERFCGTDAMPRLVSYVHCAAPLCDDVDRLAEIIVERDCKYLVCDSVACACDGPPESAETAQKYFRALRYLKVGSLNIAHITKGGEENGAEQRPFGSNFWHHMARSTWFMKRADDSFNDETVDVALIQRKTNIGPKQKRAIGMRFRFLTTETTVQAFDVVDHRELSTKLPVWQRMQAELKRGPIAEEELAKRIECKEGSIRSAVSRMELFVRLPDGRIALSAKGGDEENVPF